MGKKPCDAQARVEVVIRRGHDGSAEVSGLEAGRGDQMDALKLAVMCAGVGAGLVVVRKRKGQSGTMTTGSEESSEQNRPASQLAAASSRGAPPS